MPLSDPLARRAWDGLLVASPQQAPYADLAFADAVEAGHGWPGHIACVWHDGTLRAGALVHQKRAGPYRAAALPPLARFSALLLDGPLDAHQVHARRSPLDALLSLLASHFHQVSLNLHPSVADVRPLQWAGWRLKPAYTYRAMVASGDDATAGWSASPRRVARKHGDEYSVTSAPEDVADVMALVAGSHERQDHPLGLPAKIAHAMARRLVAEGLAQPFIARRDGVPEAGIIILRNSTEAHYWLAGSEPGPAMTVLLGALFKHLRDTGVASLDFAGANTPSIGEFKRRFGAELVVYMRARLTTRPELRLLDAALDRF